VKACPVVVGAVACLPLFLPPVAERAGAISPAAEDARPPARLYTNDDLERVRPFRDETGAANAPANPAAFAPEPARERTRGSERGSRVQGEAYWRAEARRVRLRVAALRDEIAALDAQAAEREAERRREPLGGGRTGRARGGRAGGGPSPALEGRRAALQRRIRELEDDLEERARRERALPGWLR
jgi:hypothetical protein